MRNRLFVIALCATCCACEHRDASTDEAAQRAVIHAVDGWRASNDPLYAYSAANCHDVHSVWNSAKARLSELLHTSTASACERLVAVPETTRIQIAAHNATVSIDTPNARPGSTLTFALSAAGDGSWSVSRVDARDANGDNAIYDASRSGHASNADSPDSPDDRRIEPAYSAWIPHGAAPWQITHVITYGQSLSLGYFNQPVLSTHSRYTSLRFAGGVRAQDVALNAGPGQAYRNFAPLVETRSGQQAETPTAGTLDMTMQLIEQENLAQSSHLPYRFLGSAPGEGSTDITTLSNPGPYYSRLISDIEAGKRLATADGKSYGVGAVTWTQGEADDSNNTSIADYIARLRNLRSSIDHDAKTITGQSQDVELITYQLASNRSFAQSNPHIALALLQASHEDAHIHLAAPMYLFRYVDGRHTDNHSSQWLGAYYGLVLKRILIDRTAWHPLEPLDWQRDGAVATVRFNVPAPPLAWDTRQVAGNTNYGFTLRLPSGEALPVRSVSIAGSNEVRIVASGPIPAGTHLQYAFNGTGLAGSRYGPRGNLRDSQGDAIQFDDGRRMLRMDNWCVIFDVVL